MDDFNMQQNEIVDLIAKQLEKSKESLRSFFNSPKPGIETRYFIIDDLLPADLIKSAYESFPNENQMRRMDSFREKKYTSKNLKEFNPLIGEITFALQDQKIINLISEITGFQEQIGDPHLYAGGLSVMVKGDYLNPHIDNSHNHTRDKYRTGNILYYITPNWDEASGGNLELWDQTVQMNETIVSKFNRLVFMETNLNSWHSVSPVVKQGKRCCISNYYFSSTSPMGKEYFHVTSFSGRPHQKFRRIWSKLDNELRQFARTIKKDGFGKTDLNK